MTSKGVKHLNLREIWFRGCHHSKGIDVEPIPRIINPNDIFAKEVKDNTHFRNIRSPMIVSLQAFLNYNHNVPSHIIYDEKLLPYYSIRSEHIVPVSLEIQSGVPEHIVPYIMKLQSGFIQTA